MSIVKCSVFFVYKYINRNIKSKAIIFVSYRYFATTVNNNKYKLDILDFIIVRAFFTTVKKQHRLNRHSEIQNENTLLTFWFECVIITAKSEIKIDFLNLGFYLIFI